MTEKCINRLPKHYFSRMDNLRQLWELYCKDPEAYHDDLGNLNDYGLSFDYVAPMTFNDQPEGYFRYQLSWGGPSEEFRIYADKISDYNWSIYKIEFWFLDWFDGASKKLCRDDFKFMVELLQSFFMECGSFDYVYNETL